MRASLAVGDIDGDGREDIVELLLLLTSLPLVVLGTVALLGTMVGTLVGALGRDRS